MAFGIGGKQFAINPFDLITPYDENDSKVCAVGIGLADPPSASKCCYRVLEQAHAYWLAPHRWHFLLYHRGCVLYVYVFLLGCGSTEVYLILVRSNLIAFYWGNLTDQGSDPGTFVTVCNCCLLTNSVISSTDGILVSLSSTTTTL